MRFDALPPPSVFFSHFIIKDDLLEDFFGVLDDIVVGNGVNRTECKLKQFAKNFMAIVRRGVMMR